MTDTSNPAPRGKPAVDAVRRRRPRGPRRDAGPVGELHRHQPALLGQAGLRRGRPVRPRGHPRRVRRHHARRLPRGAAGARRRRDVLAQPRRLLLRQRRRGDRDARLPRRAHHHPPRGRDAREEPARPALAGRVRAAGRRLDPAERDRLAQAQRDARIGARPARLPARAAVPARQVARLLVRPRPDPRAAQDRTARASRGTPRAYPPAGPPG